VITKIREMEVTEDKATTETRVDMKMAVVMVEETTDNLTTTITTNTTITMTNITTIMEEMTAKKEMVGTMKIRIKDMIAEDVEELEADIKIRITTSITTTKTKITNRGIKTTTTREFVVSRIRRIKNTMMIELIIMNLEMIQSNISKMII